MNDLIKPSAKATRYTRTVMAMAPKRCCLCGGVISLGAIYIQTAHAEPFDPTVHDGPIYCRDEDGDRCGAAKALLATFSA